MNRFLRWGASFVLGLAFFAGQAHASRLSDLEAEVLALKNRITEVEEREEKYRKEVEDLKKANEAETKELRKELADLKTENEALKQEISQLETMLKDLGDKVDRLETKMESKPEEPVTVQPGLTPEPGPGVKPETGSTVKPGKNLKEIYDLGLKYLKEGKYDASRAQFEAFLKAAPNDPYAGNAQFWIGECYFAQKNYKRAVLEYAKVQQSYPKSGKLPGALYKMGLCFELLGKKPEAETIYKELINSFPQSEEAKKAKTQLDQLQKAPGGNK